MELMELFMIAIGLSMDAFAVSICKGVSIGKVKLKHMCIVGLWFGGFQALMPAIGYFFGGFLTGLVEKYAYLIAFALLLIIGLNMIKEALEKDDDEISGDLGYINMFLLAVATSIDALAVGVSFAFIKMQIFYSILIIGVTTFFISLAGVKVGSLTRTRYKTKAEITGGVVLIIIGIKILVEAYI